MKLTYSKIYHYATRAEKGLPIDPKIVNQEMEKEIKKWIDFAENEIKRSHGDFLLQVIGTDRNPMNANNLSQKAYHFYKSMKNNG